MVIGLSFLLLLPFVVYQIAKRVHPSRTWAVTGLSFGLIVALASLGLYTLYFVSYLGFLPGMVGLLSSFVHDVPGFEIATALRLRNVDTIVNDQEGVIIEIINGLFWGVVYGALGYLIDRWRGPRGTGGLSNYQGKPVGWVEPSETHHL
jgi:hypothetical protein